VQLTQQQIEELAAQAGPGDTATAAAIAMAESGGRTDAVGDQGTSFGLWQIHLPAHPDVSQGCAEDPQCAARAARAISNGWSNFHPWTTFQNGAYRQYLGGSVATLANVQVRQSLAGQSVVGTRITSPWFPGTWEVTQGYGTTDYSGEPEGHGHTHWHAGVDVGCDSGTVLTLPAGLGGTARALDNPGGYGTALVLLLDNGQGVLLGHLRQRFVSDGEQLRSGMQLGATDSTGNSTGPHLHFEVRPLDSKTPLGIGRYGTDVDPSSLLLGGTADLLSASGEAANPYGPLDPRGVGWDMVQAMNAAGVKFVQGGQVVLGAGMLMGGLLIVGYGIRGKSTAVLQADVGRLVRRAPRARPQRKPAPSPVTGAERTRLRSNLQRSLPPETP